MCGSLNSGPGSRLALPRSSSIMLPSLSSKETFHVSPPLSRYPSARPKDTGQFSSWIGARLSAAPSPKSANRSPRSWGRELPRRRDRTSRALAAPKLCQFRPRALDIGTRGQRGMLVVDPRHDVLRDHRSFLVAQQHVIALAIEGQMRVVASRHDLYDSLDGIKRNKVIPH